MPIKMKKFIYKAALWLHPRYAAVLRAAKNVRAGKEDSLPLRMAWRFYMLAWQGKEVSGEARVNERHAEIERLYTLFAEPKSGSSLCKATAFCISELQKAGQAGVFFVPDPKLKEAAKKEGLQLYDESQPYMESMAFLQTLKAAALHPILFAAVYQED